MVQQEPELGHSKSPIETGYTVTVPNSCAHNICSIAINIILKSATCACVHVRSMLYSE